MIVLYISSSSLNRINQLLIAQSEKMAEPKSSTAITDMDIDALVHCASFLNLGDVSSLALSCKYLNKVAYSDSIWNRFFRERWPQQVLSSTSQLPSVRVAYFTKHTALQQFKFVDPKVTEFYMDAEHFDHMFINENNLIFSQGRLIHMMNIDSFLNGREPLLTLRDHNARITCMRFFSLYETSLFRSETQRSESVLVTSSCDHSIRLWWKGQCQRCFRGHNGEVTTLSDKLLGDGAGKVFASGGVDGTVRLWSLSSSGKRGQHALKATFKGHGKPLELMSVAGHKRSLLVSMSKDSKVRVWDTTPSSSVRSCCVGMTTVPGAPVGMKCHESLVYIAAGSSVTAIDLRTMRRVFSTPCHQPRLYSFELLPSKSLICTGGIAGAKLWDIRRISESPKEEPIAELEGHIGPVTHLHMDQYKIVSGGIEDRLVNVWESGTGTQTNTLVGNSAGRSGIPSQSNTLVGNSAGRSGVSAMAVNSCQIVTGGSREEGGIVRFTDFNHATCPTSSVGGEHFTKFWGYDSGSDSDESFG